MDSTISRIENHVHLLIDDLRSRLLYMASKSQKSFDNTCTSLKNFDFALAEAVIEGDKEINDLEIEIDASALSILARTQPVATDLRLVVSSIRLVVELERIADEASNIANRVLLMQEQTPSSLPKPFLNLIKQAQYMLEESIVSFRDKNTQLAGVLRVQQDEIIGLVVKCIDYCITSLSDKSMSPWLAMHYILIARAVERVAGRAVNIAEHTYFLVEGVNIKHRPVT